MRHFPLGYASPSQGNRRVILSAGALILRTGVEGPLPLREFLTGRQPRYIVYILGSISGALYVGITSDLVARVRQHQNHIFRGYTAKYDVDRLLYYEIYEHVTDAIQREKQLKGWRRAKKVALIEKQNPQWKDLRREWDNLRLRTKPVGAANRE